MVAVITVGLGEGRPVKKEKEKKGKKRGENMQVRQVYEHKFYNGKLTTLRI